VIRRVLLRYGWAAAAAAVLLCLYILLLRGFPRHVFWSPDEGGKFIALQTIQWTDDLRYELPYRGAAIDPQFDFYFSRCTDERIYPSPAADGTVRFYWPVWFPLASRSLFEAFGITGVYVLPLLSGWLTAVLAGVLTAQHHPRLTPLAILLVGIGTPVLFYSLCFWEHTVATVFGTLAVAVLVGSRPGRVRTLVLVVPLLLVAIVLRFEMAAFAVAVFLSWIVCRSAVRQRSAGSLSAAGGHPPWWRRVLAGTSYVLVACGVLALLLVAVDALAPLAPRHLDQLADLTAALRYNAEKLPFFFHALLRVFINAPDPQHPGVSQSFDWLAFEAVCGVCLAPFLVRRRLEAGLVLVSLAIFLEYCLVTALPSRAYMSRHGVLLVAPYLIMGVYVLPEAWRQRQYPLLALATAAGFYAATGFGALFWSRIAGDGTYGIGLDGSARYLLTLYPMAVVMSLLAIRSYRQSDRHPLVKSGVTALMVAMVALAVHYHFRGVEMLYRSKQQIARWESVLPRREPIVTDIWWLAAWAAPFFVSHDMYCVREPAQLSRWVPAARAHGIDRFTFASFAAPDTKALASEGLRPDAYRFVEGLHLMRLSLGTTEAGQAPAAGADRGEE
jgi:hypothetical protein